MALRLRKDVKKSSYYVWFLGAKESHGLRGEEYVVPVLQNLVEREKDVEPFKVTLQVSHKGIKIIQNVITSTSKSAKPKNETVKHFIPHNTITCVVQNNDVIGCILLLFNPVTKCPLHIHAYRCDSVETANLLKSQLQILIDRPENQKKFFQIEQKLKINNELSKKKKNSLNRSLESDIGTRESESSEERFTNNETRINNLYDSLAAELRQKLVKNQPILLPPRDYDTVHRQKGNLDNIDLRRSLNANIVGVNIKNTSLSRRLQSSGGSSGIGSDHAPSPDDKEDLSEENGRFNGNSFERNHNNVGDNQSTSDEDWNYEPAESTLYMMHETAYLPDRNNNSSSNRVLSPERPVSAQHQNGKVPYKSMKENYNSPQLNKHRDTTDSAEYSHSNRNTRNGNRNSGNISPILEQTRFGSYERQKSEDRQKDHYAKKELSNRNERSNFIERNLSPAERMFSDRSYLSNNVRGVIRQSEIEDSAKIQSKAIENIRYNNNYAYKPNADHRQRSPARRIEDNLSPRDRFKDAKEKFLMLEKERLEEQEQLAALRRSQNEKPITPSHTRKYSNKWENDDEFINGKNISDKYDHSLKKRDEPLKRYSEPLKRYEEPLKRYDEPLKRYEEPAKRYEEPLKRYEEPISRYNDYSARYDDSGKRFDNGVRRYDSPPVKRNDDSLGKYDSSRKDDGIRRYEEPVKRYDESNMRYDENHKNYGEAVKRYEEPIKKHDQQFRRYDDQTNFLNKNRHNDNYKNLSKTRYDDRQVHEENEFGFESNGLHNQGDNFRNIIHEKEGRYVDERNRFSREDEDKQKQIDDDRNGRKHDQSEMFSEEKRTNHFDKNSRYLNSDKNNDRYKNKKSIGMPQQFQRSIPENYRINYEVPLSRYRDSSPANDRYNIEDSQRKKSTNEVISELKRRSYVERDILEKNRFNNHHSGKFIDRDRYSRDESNDYRLSKSTLELDKFDQKTSPKKMSNELTKSTVDLDKFDDDFMKYPPRKLNLLKNTPGFRYSYAEPKMYPGQKYNPETLHRTNSTVSNSGRVGIASIEPY